MGKTKIEWVKNPDGSSPGYTLNPVTGCKNHIRGLCKGGNFPCYAYRLAHGRMKEIYLANNDLAPIESGASPSWSMFNDPFYPRFWPSRLAEIEALGRATANSSSGIRRGRARGIFLCNMGELFGPWLPKEWTERILEAAENDPEDRFYLLTKQPWELVFWPPFSSNCWVGVTATNAIMASDAIYFLNKVQANIRFLSIEPFLEPINLSGQLKGVIDWLIIGGQTVPEKLPERKHVAELIRAADQAGIPVFLKDNLKPLFPQAFADREHAPPPFFTADWEYRQEMPSEHSLENVSKEK